MLTVGIQAMILDMYCSPVQNHEI